VHPGESLCGLVLKGPRSGLHPGLFWGIFDSPRCFSTGARILNYYNGCPLGFTVDRKDSLTVTCWSPALGVHIKRISLKVAGTLLGVSPTGEILHPLCVTRKPSGAPEKKGSPRVNKDPRRRTRGLPPTPCVISSLKGAATSTRSILGGQRQHSLIY